MFTGILFQDGQIKGDRSGFKLDFFFSNYKKLQK